MALVLDPRIDVADAATIVLAGEPWLVPPLVLRQIRRIGPQTPAIIALLNRIIGADGAREKALAARAEALAAGIEPPALDPLGLIAASALTEDETEAALSVIHAGLTRAYPGATRDDLDDMPIQLSEIFPALTSVMAQTRLVKPASEAPKPGEALAAS